MRIKRTFFYVLTVLIAVLGIVFIVNTDGVRTYADSTVTVPLTQNDTGVILLDQDRDGLTVRMDIKELEFIRVSTTEGSFVLPRIDGFSRNFDEGDPTLPIASNLISIPFKCNLKAEVLESTTMDVDLESYGLKDKLIPVQPPAIKSQNPADRPFVYNRSTYNAGGKYSKDLVSTEIVGTMRSLRLGRLSIAPVEYYPDLNKLTVHTSVTVKITFKNADWDLTNRMKEKYSSFYFDAVNTNILNYESPTREADLVVYPIKYVIVADRMFETQLQPFIQWKTRKGYIVEVGYTDTIGSSTSAIKSYIQGIYNAANPAPSFVLLVGDVQQIPSWSGSAGSHITDLRYCEFTGDDLPEIYYGRFSAQNTSELQPQIDKTLEYEQYTMPDPSYLGEVTLVSGVDSTYASTHGNGQINYGTTYYFNAAHGISTNVWLYPASDASGASSAIIQTISDGVGFYNYTAHCSHNGPADPSFSPSDIASLTNAHKYLLGIGNCCLSNTFGSDYSTPCFGEAWLQAEDKGGIGWIGGSNNTYWDEDYWWGVGNGPIVAAGPTYAETGIGVYDGVFHDHGEPVTQHYTTNGAMIFAGNTAVTEAGSSRTQYYWEIYHLMGDPSVMTYMGVPAANSVTHPASVVTTDTSISVQAVEGSYVGITFGGVWHGAGYVGSSGSVSVAITPFGSTGTADIVVTCQNRIPYISTISVTGGTTPPTAEFSGTPVSGQVPLTVNFTDQSSGATSWSWDFGDTGTSTAQNPSHQYTSAGTYTVSLTATNAYGSDTETKTNYITVTALQPPVADFTASSTTIYAGQSVTFTDASTNNPTSWSWTFDGGTPGTSADQNPVITYNTAGTYTVSLQATNGAGSDTETKTNYITVSDQPLVYCDSQGNNYNYEYIGNVTIGDLDNTSVGSNYTDYFDTHSAHVNAGDTVNVSLTPIFPSSTYTEFWKIWIDYNLDGDFGDAGEEVFSDSGTTAVSGSFTVPAGASGTIRMRVSMKWDSAPTPCETFSYGEVEDYAIVITPGTLDLPVAEFSASSTVITAGQSITFTDQSTNNPTSWSWSFTGGTPSSSTAQNPTITYNTEGTYTVELTATNSAGSDTETKVDYITVNPVTSGIVFETGSVSSVGSSWQTVNLGNTYTSPVVVCSTGYASSSTSPAVVRVRNAAGSSFDVKVQNPGDGSALSGYTVWYMVVEEGVYTEAADGVTMEAVKVNSTITAENNSWVEESRSYSNSYTTPVVLGQVMTDNDAGWSVFWANGGSRSAEPSATAFNAGKEVAEDSDTTRNNETIGYIVIEAGSGTINGKPYTAALGPDTVRGPGNTTSGYNYTFGSITNASVAIVSANGMDGGNGGWPVLFGSTPITDTSITLVFDEDQVGDSERNHTPEAVAYIVFGQ